MHHPADRDPAAITPRTSFLASPPRITGRRVHQPSCLLGPSLTLQLVTGAYRDDPREFRIAEGLATATDSKTELELAVEPWVPGHPRRVAWASIEVEHYPVLIWLRRGRDDRRSTNSAPMHRWERNCSRKRDRKAWSSSPSPSARTACHAATTSSTTCTISSGWRSRSSSGASAWAAVAICRRGEAITVRLPGGIEAPRCPATARRWEAACRTVSTESSWSLASSLLASQPIHRAPPKTPYRVWLCVAGRLGSVGADKSAKLREGAFVGGRIGAE
jgi:hypothetical protein